MESVPGRIETFIPELKYYRITSWRSPNTNKEHILYGNILILTNYVKRYHSIIKRPRNKNIRQNWEKDLIIDIENNIFDGQFITNLKQSKQ